ncbi:MAG TPA: rhomboid family intramembrane serine protease [Candidatus Eubacterium avistercoris]|uniref:Rhomboid family intramembrane serine protease n=1 Tax=Candidatus Eubacterium avistercoris TaxID=2838567 RepID=A0A9D2D2D0_9FIRM|nr:rhomboid family intramembrane serine protease [Candidatus Eubacterium avistercoris]
MYRESRFRSEPENEYITPVNITLAVINVAVFFIMSILERAFGNQYLYQYGAMFPPAVLGGQWYRLITSSFIHFDIAHLFNNMLLFITLGSYLERAFGKIRYIIFFFSAAVLSSLASMFHMIYSKDLAFSAGASGIVFGMIGALLYMVIRNKGRFQNLTIRRFMIMILLSLYFGFVTAGVDNAAHVGGLCAGFLLGILLYRKEKAQKHH